MPRNTIGPRTSSEVRSGTAERLVDAARTIIVRDGLAALTFTAIENEAGVSRSLIHYHFGGRAGLLLAVVDSMFAQWELEAERASHVGADSLDALNSDLELSRRISADRDTTVLLMELLPHIYRTEELRGRYQERNRLGIQLTYQALLPLLGPDEEECVADLSRMVVTMMTGLGVEFVIDPDNMDHVRLYRRWKDIVRSYLGSVRDSDASPQTASQNSES